MTNYTLPTHVGGCQKRQIVIYHIAQMSTDVSRALFGTQRGDLVSEDLSMPRTMLGTGSETRLSLASLWQEATYLDCFLWCGVSLEAFTDNERGRRRRNWRLTLQGFPLKALIQMRFPFKLFTKGGFPISITLRESRKMNIRFSH